MSVLLDGEYKVFAHDAEFASRMADLINNDQCLIVEIPGTWNDKLNGPEQLVIVTNRLEVGALVQVNHVLHKNRGESVIPGTNILKEN